LVGADPRSDLALYEDRTPAMICPWCVWHSFELKAGEWVLAIGSPLALIIRFTAGITVAKPSLPIRKPIFLYPDATVAINPGKFRRPAVDLGNGEVIGINSSDL